MIYEKFHNKKGGLLLRRLGGWHQTLATRVNSDTARPSWTLPSGREAVIRVNMTFFNNNNNNISAYSARTFISSHPVT